MVPRLPAWFGVPGGVGHIFKLCAGVPVCLSARATVGGVCFTGWLQAGPVWQLPVPSLVQAPHQHQVVHAAIFAGRHKHANHHVCRVLIECCVALAGTR